MSEYDNGYDEGYRFGMQKMREFGHGRIEELEEQNKRLRLEVAHANDTADAAIERTKELEAMLAKAVDVLSDLADCVDDGCFCSEVRMAAVMDYAYITLAEIKGGKDV